MNRINIGFLFLNCISIWGQKDSILTLSLVNITSEPAFQIGHRIEEYDLNFENLNNALNLSEYLGTHSGVAFKTYGYGMLSGITNRGLSSAHTNVYWNNIPLNSRLNGQSDFSLLPTTNFKKLEFRKGGGSALLGSGSVGGSIILEDYTHKNSRNFVSFKGNVGSYGMQNYNFKGVVNFKKISLGFSIDTLSSNNDYEVPRLMGRVKQANAKVKTNNSSAYLSYLFNPYQSLTFSIWSTSANRQLPGTYFAPQSRQLQMDESNRLNLQYLYSKNRLTFSTQIAKTDEKTEYFSNKDNGEASVSKVDNYFFITQGSYQFKKNWKGSLKYFQQHSRGKSENFGEPIQNEGYITASIFKKINTKWQGSLSLQKGFSNAFSIPFTLDAGIFFEPKKGHHLYSNFTTNYRNPTFNDLYWGTGGNPNLKSEKGWMSDFGYTYEHTSRKLKFQMDGFWGRFKDWIQWQPNQSGIWQATNLKGVENYGIESSLEKKWRYRFWQFLALMKYHYTHSVDKNTNAFLPYIPKNKWVLATAISYKKLKFQYHQIWNSKRPVNNANSEYLEPFSIGEISLSYPFKIWKLKSYVMANINNVFNKEYQSIPGYYMPGRNYRTSLQIQL